LVTGTPENKPKLKSGERFADESFALSVLPKREFGAHKWSVGGLIIVAGGPGYIGAAALVAMSAGRCGAGVVNVAIPRGAMSAVASLVPEAAFIPLSEGDLDSSARRAREAISEKLERSQALVVGPGMGQDEYVDALLGAVFGKHAARKISEVGFRKRGEPEATPAESAAAAMIGGEKPAVVDADGLNWLAKQTEWWTSVKPKSLVLTPHIGEMARLAGKTNDEVLADPHGLAREFAATWQQIVVLKHGHTIATDGTTSIVAEAAPLSLATAGSGDILAGAIGAFLAQGLAPLDAAGLALHVGLKAAARVESKYGVIGTVASDLPAAMAETLAELERKRDGANG
jgi:NAD(P)H-hydrate epimerase